jgi:hypothetical protein
MGGRMGRVIVVFLRRLWLPLLLLAGFGTLCVRTYMRLEGLRWQDALFWIANAIRNSGADEVIIPEYEGGLMTGRMIQKYYPLQTKLE